MKKLCWFVVFLALMQGGWFVFDGLHAFNTGDYVTPSEGPYAGQLGPWSKLVEAVGLEPRSDLVKGVHVGLGVATLAVIALFVLSRFRARRGVLLCAVLSLWYLPFGALLGILQILFLLSAGKRLNSQAKRSSS